MTAQSQAKRTAAERQRRAACLAAPVVVNRYCRAGMCVKTDAEHEPWCAAHHKPITTPRSPA